MKETAESLADALLAEGYNKNRDWILRALAKDVEYDEESPEERAIGWTASVGLRRRIAAWIREQRR